MDDDPYALPYEVARHSVAGQHERLNNLRARAATLLSAAAIVTSFLGAQALDDQKLAAKGQLVADHHLQLAELLAIAAFVGVAVCSILILLPGTWAFGLNARDIIRTYVETDDPLPGPRVHRDLALHLEGHYDKNTPKLRRLFSYFRIGACLLAVEVLLWMVDLV